MALKSTIFKVDLQISDLRRHYYQQHLLTLAQHPSETDERMMVRILAFAIHAHENLQFTKGLSTDDEPELWLRDMSGQIELWIELGQLDEKRIRKACNRADKVYVYTYQNNSATVWWQQIKNKLSRFKNLSVVHLTEDASKKLTGFCQKNMRLQCTVEENEIWFSDEILSVHLQLETWM